MNYYLKYFINSNEKYIMIVRYKKREFIDIIKYMCYSICDNKA